MSNQEERGVLLARYANTPNRDLAKMLGISVEMVKRRAGQMGLMKDPKYRSDMNRKSGMKSTVAKYWKSLHES